MTVSLDDLKKMQLPKGHLYTLIKPLGVSCNENPTSCFLCRGSCCWRGSGELSSHQVDKLSTITIMKLFGIGFSVDFGNRDQYKRPYLRPQMIISVDKPKACIFHSDHGCLISFNYRPLECQLLIPNEKHQCNTDKNSLQSKFLERSWEPYEHLIYAAIHLTKRYYPEHDIFFRSSFEKVGY